MRKQTGILKFAVICSWNPCPAGTGCADSRISSPVQLQTAHSCAQNSGARC